MSPTPKLIDVVALSQSCCDHPIGCELKYATSDNFVGRVIDGYDPRVTQVGLLTEKVANVICKLQNELLRKHRLSLFIFDAYRPKRAVMDFLRWSQEPENEVDRQRKLIHYPYIEKSELFARHYLGRNSKHCYGNTIDCVLQNLNGHLLNMGAVFDFFGELSHADRTEKEIGKEAAHYRKILTEAFVQNGFEPYHYEYWHFTHPSLCEVDEPMDIPVTG